MGAGRLGSAIVATLQKSGVKVSGPHGRGYRGGGDGTVLLCVPDDAIAVAASMIEQGPVVGHCSGATRLDVFGGRSGFSVHPLMTVTWDGADFAGVWAAVAGTDAVSLAAARALADVLGLRAVVVDEDDRAAYHAAAAIAANFLVTVESAAAELMSTAGLNREVLVPLARAALENWARGGPAALTGPVARGDIGTVAVHRQVVADRTPDLLELFDALVAATRRLASADGNTVSGIPSAESGSAGSDSPPGPLAGPQTSESTP